MDRPRNRGYRRGKLIVRIFSFGLLSVFCLGPFLGRSLGNTPLAAQNKSSGEIKKTRIVIGNIKIEEPRIILRLGGSKKSEGSVFDQLPSMARGSVDGGSAEIVLKESQQKISLRNANISISDFSPQKGGTMSFRGEVRYERYSKDRIEIDGMVSAAVDMRAFKPAPACTGSLSVDIDHGSYGTVLFNHLSAKVPLSLHGDEIALKAVEFAMGDAQFKISDKPVTVADVRLHGDVAYNRKEETVAVSSLKGSLPPAGDFSGSVRVGFKGPSTFKASIDTPALDIGKINEAIKAYLPAEYRSWAAQGKAAIHSDIDGVYSQKALSFKVGQRIAVTGGGLSSGDGTKAAQGVQSQADLTASYDTALEEFTFELRSTLSGGEALWGGYYGDFKGKKTRADGKGTFHFSGEMPFAFSAETDLLGAGPIKIAGSGKRGGQIFSMDAKGISLQKIVATFLEDYLKQNYPSLAGLQIDGSSSFELKIRRTGQQNDVDGLITFDIPSLAFPAQNIAVSGIRLELPFDLGYPKTVLASTKRQGILEINSAEKDKIKTGNIRIPLFLSGNKFWLPVDADIRIARGDVIISNFKADDILSPERKISCGIRINNVKLRPIEGSFTLSPINGTISAYYPKVEYFRDALTVDGSTKVNIFGGEIEIAGISIERLSAASRKIDTGISFKNISLEKVTEKIAIGKMTGVIQGSLKDFEMEYGQPTHFVLDIDSVDTSGVSQRISVEAIQSISILGTGSGMSGVLNRGIMSFFKDYPYSRIGMQAKLGNDVFTIRGKIHSGGTEYLVRRGFLLGVDVVNQNPDNKISFKDMQERLMRIVESRKAGGTPVVQ
jgi:adhesin HecA-like repeat protein